MSCVCRPETDRECHREGGRLASIHSQDEMDFVAILVKSARVQNPQYRPNIFIGLEQGGQGTAIPAKYLSPNIMCYFPLISCFVKFEVHSIFTHV